MHILLIQQLVIRLKYLISTEGLCDKDLNFLFFLDDFKPFRGCRKYSFFNYLITSQRQGRLKINFQTTFVVARSTAATPTTKPATA